jgi:hypothetical protein
MIETQKFGAAENEEVELKRWQKSVINLMKQQDDRPVLQEICNYDYDFDSTFYTKWFCSEKRISYS